MNDMLKRTAISTTAIPTFERFILDANGTEDTLHVYASDGATLLGLVKRLETYRGKVSRQWHITGFGERGKFIFDFEQIEQVVNEYLDNR